MNTYSTIHGFTKIPLDVQSPISNTTYEPHEQESAEYSDIKHIQPQDTVKSQKGTGLEETLRYALDHLECFVLVTT